MHHITSREQLIKWLVDHPPNRVVQRALERGKVTLHGLFKGGWVVEAEYHGQSYIVGIRPVGVECRLICGLLKAVPVSDYVGGDTPVNKGDGR